MNDQDLTKTDYDPDRSLVLIEGLSHFLTNFLQNLASCQTSLNNSIKILLPYIRKFLRKKNKVGKNKLYNEQKQVKNCVSKYLKLWN
jgi:hypothetical protein